MRVIGVIAVITTAIVWSANGESANAASPFDGNDSAYNINIPFILQTSVEVPLNQFLLALIVIPLSIAAVRAAEGPKMERPNIVVIYTDDLGYGDVSCYGAKSVKTPNIDRLASEGLRFIDAHSPAATCTPSRYSLLTGQYAFRKPGTGILPGNANLIIDPEQVTVPSMLQNAGYKTGVVGKWHLGLGKGEIDWNTEIRPGPLEVGFDYAFLMPATGDRVPCVYFENRNVVGLSSDDPLRISFGKPIGDEPTGKSDPQRLIQKPSHGHNQTIVNGISRIGYMTGGRSARWNDEQMADRFVQKARDFIRDNKDNPFFLFFSTHDIHVPRLPSVRFLGSTTMGPRGDAIVQADWCVEQLFASLRQYELDDNTLIIFTSDNGPVVDDGYHDDAVEKLGDHQPAGPFRGGKYSAFEAGTRVPMIVHWPGQVEAGTSSALVSQVDFLASFAKLTGQTVSPDLDSEDVLPALLGKSPDGREYLVQQSRTLSVRHNRWKYIAPGKGPKVNKNTNIELGLDPQPQLYNLAFDLGETTNVIDQYPEVANQLAAKLKEIQDR